MEKNFSDHFAAVAANYAGFRPTYPDTLYQWLRGLAPSGAHAWDCACGSGQATLGLAGHFDRVTGTDASASQIASARPHPRVTYRVAPAQESGLPDHSADLITVAQALHWFDVNAFYAEAKRVLKPSGILAVWTYGMHETDSPAVDARVSAFYSETVGPYWPPERDHVETGYRDLPFPFTEIPAPLFRLEAQWSLAELLGYLGSWSATGRFRKEKGFDPILPLGEELLPLWGAPEQTRPVQWPLKLRVGRPAAG